MATLDDFRAHMQRMQEGLLRELPNIATVLTLSAKAIAERKIKDKGFGATYSANKYPAFFLHGRELNGKGTAFLKKKGVDTSTGKQGKATHRDGKKLKKGEEATAEDSLTNWAEFRGAQGLQTGHVDLTYTGKMFAGMAPLDPKITGAKVIVELGANNKQVQDEMNYNRDRYGDFIGKSLDAQDFNLLGDIVRARILDVIKNIK